MSCVTPSGRGTFLVFNVLISASSSYFWMASVMHPPAGMFSESCFFISFLACFVLSQESFTVLSSWYIWAKQFAALFWVRCSFCDSMTVCRFSGLSSLSSLMSLNSFIVSFSILRDAVFSCHAVLVW